MFSNSLLLRTGVGMVCGVLLFSLVAFAPPLPAQADPISLIVGAVVLLTGGVVYDYISCGVNIIWGCSGDGGGSGGPGGPTPPVTGGYNPGVNPGTGGVGGPGGGGGTGGTGAVACVSTLANACGMHGTGFMVNGVCNATVPPNSACPIPTIGDNGFRADPALVRSGGSTTLYWDVEDATMCSISGGLLSLTGLGILGDTDTGTINEKTVYTLTCTNGPGGPSASAQATVNLVPSFQEI